MFRLARLILFVGLGFYLGLKFNGLTQQSECSTMNGTWHDGVCLVTELPK